MTNLRINTTDLPALLAQMTRASVGFDHMFDRLNQYTSQAATSINYPPHNIVKVSDSEFIVQLAVAGFELGDLSVSQEKSELKVSGRKEGTSLLTGEVSVTPAREYLYHGISDKPFSKTFCLAEYVEVDKVELNNGLLNIYVSQRIPDNLKPRVINITQV